MSESTRCAAVSATGLPAPIASRFVIPNSSINGVSRRSARTTMVGGSSPAPIRCRCPSLNSYSHVLMTGSNVTRNVPARGGSVRGAGWGGGGGGGGRGPGEREPGAKEGGGGRGAKKERAQTRPK